MCVGWIGGLVEVLHSTKKKKKIQAGFLLSGTVVMHWMLNIMQIADVYISQAIAHRGNKREHKGKCTRAIK